MVLTIKFVSRRWRVLVQQNCQFIMVYPEEASKYRVTIHVVPNLPLTLKQKFHFSMRLLH